MLENGYFISPKLYPNVDCYSGIIYQAAMFPVMFAIRRTIGQLAQWQKMVTNSERETTPPHQIFAGDPLALRVPT